MARANKDAETIGKTFGRLTVISFSHSTGSQYYNCTCACGGTKVAKGSALRWGTTRSCGCLNKEKHKLNVKDYSSYIGQTFDRLTVIELVPSGSKRLEFLCKCICGNTKIVKKDSLVSRAIKSCGCLRRRIAISEGF